MSMNMPDRIPKYVRDSHEMHEENKGTVFDTGVVHRPRTKEQYEAQPTTDHKSLPERAPSMPTRPRTRAVTSEADFEDLADNGSERPAAPRPGGRKYLNDPVETHGLSKKQASANKSNRRRAKIRQKRSSVELSAATANNPMRSETALDSESNEAHDRAEAKKIDRNRQLVSTNWQADQHKEDLAAGQANLQQGDGVPDWASKDFAEQTLEKGPVEGSVPRGSEPADKTYESSASKEGITAMGPGASSQAVTRSAESVGKKPKSIRKLEGTLPGSRSLKNPKLKPYDPESTPSVEARNLSDRRAFKDNKKQAAGSYKRPEEPLTGPERESEPEPKRSMFQRLKDRFK
jgi:hypothetical protein